MVASQGTFDPDSRVWSLGDLASSASATITVEVLITTPQAVVNRTIVFTADLPDPDLSNNEASATLVIPGADVSVSKIVDVAAPAIGSNVTFSVGVANSGPDTALGVRVVDPLPGGLVFVSATPSVGTYDDATGVWTVGDLLPGDIATLTVTATVTATTPVTNTATATSTGPPDVVPDNNTASTTVTPLLARVTVTKTVDNTAPVVGGMVTFTITVVNAGPGGAGDVVVTDTMPDGLTPTAATAPCVITGQQVQCVLGAVPAGTTITLQFQTQVVRTGAFTNGVTFSGIGVDSGSSVASTSAVLDATSPNDTGNIVARKGALPFTGANTRGHAPIAWAALALGSVLVGGFRARRRPPARAISDKMRD